MTDNTNETHPDRADSRPSSPPVAEQVASAPAPAPAVAEPVYAASAPRARRRQPPSP